MNLIDAVINVVFPAHPQMIRWIDVHAVSYTYYFLLILEGFEDTVLQ